MANHDTDLRADYGWSDYGIELGRNLQRARAARGLSQERVAQLSGISANTYQRYEQGQSRPGEPMNPQMVTLLWLGHVLDVPIGELLPAFEPEIPAAG